MGFNIFLNAFFADARNVLTLERTWVNSWSIFEFTPANDLSSVTSAVTPQSEKITSRNIRPSAMTSGKLNPPANIQRCRRWRQILRFCRQLLRNCATRKDQKNPVKDCQRNPNPLTPILIFFLKSVFMKSSRLKNRSWTSYPEEELLWLHFIRYPRSIIFLPHCFNFLTTINFLQ